ncbi:MAG TPA: TetR/AcrR family transcriptional regulator [Friedmanniella sp.]
MAGRPVDQQRRDELLDAVVSYAVDHGLAAVTWRPLATALGVTPTTLVHRFGSKEGMLEAVQRRLRERILAETTPPGGEQTDLPTYARRVWERASDPSREGEFRLFFAVYGQALQEPRLFADFLAHVVAAPLTAFADATTPDARPAVTLAIASIRGLLLDLLTTGDRNRITAAAESLFAALASPAVHRR